MDKELEFESQFISNEKLLQIRKKQKIVFIRDSKIYKTFLIFNIIYCLFGEDLRQIISSDSNDFIFYIITFISFVFFILHFIFKSKVKNNFRFSILFWLDIISSLALFFDIGWISNGFFISHSITLYFKIGKGVTVAFIGMKLYQYFDLQKYLRLFKLNRPLKNTVSELKQNFKNHSQKQKNMKTLYNNFENVSENSFKEDQTFSKEVQKFDNKTGFQNFYPSFQPKFEFNNQKNDDFLSKGYSQKISSSGKQLAKNNVKRVLTILLVILLLIPFLQIDTYWKHPEADQFELYSLIALFQDQNQTSQMYFEQTWNQYIASKNSTDFPFLYIQMFQYSQKQSKFVKQTFPIDPKQRQLINNLRNYELILVQAPEIPISQMIEGQLYIQAYFNGNPIANFNSKLNIGRTFFLLIIFFFTGVFFARDAYRLVILPIEDMIKKIKKIQNNPVEAAKEIQLESQQNQKNALKDKNLKIEMKESKNFETNTVLNILLKCGELLSLGLGEAGIELVIKNLQLQRLNPLIPGTKIMCIFGFCDIRDFSNASTLLRQDLIQFVNSVADIIQNNTQKFKGSTNKNLGEAFLIVWKFPERDCFRYHQQDELGNQKKEVCLNNDKKFSQNITNLCEMSILSFIYSSIGYKKSKNLQEYKNDERMKNFNLQMGFGLHLGWAIEGAIGSEYKIDASYLSPNVNITSRIEAATKQYGVNLLISGQIKELLTNQIQKMFRLVDVVYLKGSKLEIELWSFDMDLSDIEAERTYLDKLQFVSLKEKKLLLNEDQKQFDCFQEEIFSGKLDCSELFQDPSILKTRKLYSQDFYNQWELGFEFYIKGEWKKAEQYFQITLNYFEKFKDGPSDNLLKYIRYNQRRAPKGWKGVRSLINK